MLSQMMFSYFYFFFCGAFPFPFPEMCESCGLLLHTQVQEHPGAGAISWCIPWQNPSHYMQTNPASPAKWLNVFVNWNTHFMVI